MTTSITKMLLKLNTGVGSVLPDVQLFGGLHEAGLVRLLQHLLSVAHQTTVLQHALVLLHLQQSFNRFFSLILGKWLHIATLQSTESAVYVKEEQATLGRFSTDLSLKLFQPPVARLFDGVQHV